MRIHALCKSSWCKFGAHALVHLEVAWMVLSILPSGISIAVGFHRPTL
jgi:hypothetical protein